MSRDVKELIIATLADSEADLIAYIADLIANCDAYRAVAVEAIHELRNVTKDRDRLRRLLRALRHDTRTRPRAAA